MRTTLHLTDDSYALVRSIADRNRSSLSRTLGHLVESGLKAEGVIPGERGALGRDPRTGMPLVRPARDISEDDVRSLDDGE